jgi:hypothetical protein
MTNVWGGLIHGRALQLELEARPQSWERPTRLADTSSGQAFDRTTKKLLQMHMWIYDCRFEIYWCGTKSHEAGALFHGATFLEFPVLCTEI